jgi:hypothetical protein
MGTIRGKVREGINVTTLTFLLPAKQEQRTVKETLKEFGVGYTG